MTILLIKGRHRSSVFEKDCWAVIHTKEMMEPYDILYRCALGFQSLVRCVPHMFLLMSRYFGIVCVLWYTGCEDIILIFLSSHLYMGRCDDLLLYESLGNGIN